jgi:hypothetical protein
MKTFKGNAMRGKAAGAAKKLYGRRVKFRKRATFTPLLPYIQMKNRCIDIDRVGWVRIGAWERR